ncbi:MAG: hypothetical protein LIO44_00250 [Eubacterium sp.]|nr:hypothetical protein [Eubacterium sp.]
MSEQTYTTIPEKADFTGEAESIFCCECGETYLFHLKDKTHEFSLGLQDFIKCLWFAQELGAIPKISPDWWYELKHHYDIYLPSIKKK